MKRAVPSTSAGALKTLSPAAHDRAALLVLSPAGRSRSGPRAACTCPAPPCSGHRGGHLEAVARGQQVRLDLLEVLAGELESGIVDRLLPALAAGRDALGHERADGACGTPRPSASPTRAPTCRDTAARPSQLSVTGPSPPRLLLLAAPARVAGAVPPRAVPACATTRGTPRASSARGARRGCQHRAAGGARRPERHPLASRSASGPPPGLEAEAGLASRSTRVAARRRPPRPGCSSRAQPSSRVEPGHLRGRRAPRSAGARRRRRRRCRRR